MGGIRWKSRGKSWGGSHVVSLSSKHQRAFDRTEATTHGHRKGNTVPGEIAKGVCPVSLPRKPVGGAGQVQGRVGLCPPEWTHRNEVCCEVPALAEGIEVTASSSPSLSLPSSSSSSAAEFTRCSQSTIALSFLGTQCVGPCMPTHRGGS